MVGRDNSSYPAVYGEWSGNPTGRKPDFDRCCADVYSRLMWTSHQCARKRGFGPGEAYCKQHDPTAEAKRRAASEAKYAAERDTRRYEAYGRVFYASLKAIAEGHNDPATLARETLAKFAPEHPHD